MPRPPRSRFTIERIRTVLLIGGGLLVAAIAIFLFVGGWTRRLLTRDLPKRLGVNIESQADGVNYTQSRKGKTLFKIHAARAVRMKLSDKTVLHDVVIHLYGEDGTESDTISGSEFQYDPGQGVAAAAGAVEITLMRPDEKPAIAQLKPGSAKPSPHPATSPASVSSPKDRQIHVKTSGLVFNQKTGVATTQNRVDFTLQQGSGASTGATYDSSKGQLILDSAVELHIVRGQAQGDNGPVTVHASHAEFERSQQLCQLTQAQANSSGGSAEIANALLHFRKDGSIAQLDGSGGVNLRTEKGAHITSPKGTLAFDEASHLRHGVLTGGAHIDMVQPNRQTEGTAPTARLQFDNEGQLRQAHLEQGVAFRSRQQGSNAKGTAVETRRTWNSQSADITFVPVGVEAQASTRHPSPVKSAGQQGQLSESHVEARTIRGYGGVVVTSEIVSAGVTTPSRLGADTVIAELAPGGDLSSLSGTGHSSFEQQNATGAHQSSSSDQLDVRFVPGAPAKGAATTKSAPGNNSEIASVVETGHVVLTQDPPRNQAGHAQHAANESSTQTPIRATASRADYDGKTQLLHLSGSPRIRDGALDLTALRIDFARDSGDAFAQGDVRASWSGAAGQASFGSGVSPSGSSPPGSSLLQTGVANGSNGPIHAVSAEAELHQNTQQVIFRAAESGASAGVASGPANLGEPRLWQGPNSVSAPILTLNRQKQTLDAETSSKANPVVTVLVSNPPARSSTARPGNNKSQQNGKENPSVIRLRSGDLHYSEGERVALFHAGPVGSVTAQTNGPDSAATVISQQAEVKLYPSGTHPGASQSGNASANTAIDRLTALGHVSVDWPDRKGTGEKLVYRSEDGNFTLTGSSSAPPRITDQARGTVTGSALIFHSRDDSVTVEGDGQKTVTETQSRK